MSVQTFRMGAAKTPSITVAVCVPVCVGRKGGQMKDEDRRYSRQNF